MSDKEETFFREYKSEKAREQSSIRNPFNHQKIAIKKLNLWFNEEHVRKQ